MRLASGHLGAKIRPGDAIRYWRVSHVAEARYDIADSPMTGRMDASFFLARDRNFIPHEYPCRTEFARTYRGRMPEPMMEFSVSRFWVPFGSDRVDLSGFWFRPTRIGAWAETMVQTAKAGPARLRLATCGGAFLLVNGRETGFMAPYMRNLEHREEFEIALQEGENRIRVYFDDLAERDARFYFQLDYLSGPRVEAGIPVPVASGTAKVLERLLEGMRFERSAFLAGEVAVLLPEPAPTDLTVKVGVDGDFFSASPDRRILHLARGECRLVIGRVEDLPSDFRHFRFTLAVGEFSISRALGVEICDAERQGEPSPLIGERIGEALDHVAERSEKDSVRAFACLALGRGGEETDGMIEAVLPAIEQCYDCSDFALVPLIWARTVWGEAMGAAIRERVDRAIFHYRYWMDEPGNDVQWYFSENHALLFHTAGYLAGHLLPDEVFSRSERRGREQAAINLERVRSWFDHFEMWGMAEWNSAPYFPIDFKGLSALFALAPDADVRDRAGAAIVRLLEIVARCSHRGMVTASQGRSYEHSLIPGRSLELSGVARLLWGRGWYGRRFHCLPLLAVCIRDYGLKIPEQFAGMASFEDEGAQEWFMAQGENGFARLYHYKTRNFSMGSVAAYRSGAWGYQETVLHLRAGARPEAQIWINHPGETIQFGSGRPSYWGGCGTLPRVHQYRALAVVDFDADESQPDFTHAWLPQDAFDEVEIEGRFVAARSGDALLLMIGSSDLVPVEAGPTAGMEMRLPGRRGCWFVRLSEMGVEGSLAAFRQRFSGLRVRIEGDMFVIDDPDYGPVVCEAGGTLRAEGRLLDPRDWTIKGEARLLKP